MKKRIRLTESDLHRIVKQSVNRILTEANGLTTNEYGEEVYTGESVYEYFKELMDKYGERQLLKFLFREIPLQKMYEYLKALDVERDVHGNKISGNDSFDDGYERHQEMRGPFGSM